MSKLGRLVVVVSLCSFPNHEPVRCSGVRWPRSASLERSIVWLPPPTPNNLQLTSPFLFFVHCTDDSVYVSTPSSTFVGLFVCLIFALGPQLHKYFAYLTTLNYRVGLPPRSDATPCNLQSVGGPCVNWRTFK